MLSIPEIPSHLWQTVFQNTQEAILISNPEGVIVEVNPAFTRITGYSREEAVGQTTKLLKSGYQDKDFYRKFWQSLAAEGKWQGEIWNRRKNGDVYPEILTVSSIRSGDKIQYYIAIFYDISFLKEQIDRFRHLAHHDALTGLPNRLALELFLPQALARARRQGTLLVLGMIDLDDFKPINDTFGHKAGDDLLRAFAQRLQQSVRSTDMVARFGGDEFVIVLEGLVRESEVENCLDRIGEICRSPFILPEGIEAKIGLSLGWILYPDDDAENTNSADRLLRNADMALYVAKAEKGDRASWRHRWGQTAQTQILAAHSDRIEGYGDLCERLLRIGAPTIADAARQFVEAFYASLAKSAESASILATLSGQEMQHLKDRQAEHLHWLLNPELTAEQHRERALQIGQIHALVGVRPSTLVQAMGIYQQNLVDRIIAMPARVVDRASLVQVINIRLEQELRAEIDAVEQLQAAYRHWLADCARAASAAGSIDAYIAACIDRLVELPGMAAAAWGQPGGSGQAVVRHASGRFNDYIEALRNARLDTELALSENSRSQSTVARAWASRAVVVNPSYIRDHHHARWRETAWAVGIRSSAAVPVTLRDEPIGVVSLYGRYPAQFEGLFMRDLLDTLQYVLSWAAACSSASRTAQPPTTAHASE